MLDAWSLGDRPPDSVLEVRMADLLRRHGLPLAQFQRPVLVAGRRLRPDFTYPSARVIIEVVGWQDHGHRQAFEADPERAAVLTAAGWVVLTFTWLQVLRRPELVADCVRATLAQRGAAA